MRGFGDLEAVIMDIMWRREDAATVRQVQQQLSSARPVAYTTVMTVMDNLFLKGFLQRQMTGRAWSYEPTASREQYTAQLMRDALDAADDQSAALAHFVASMSESQSQMLRWLLRRRSGGGR